MQASGTAKNVARAAIVVVLAFSLTGCTWLNWFIRPWKERPPDTNMETVLQKLDGIAASTTIISREMAGLDKRFAALEERVLAMEARMGNLAMVPTDEVMASTSEELATQAFSSSPEPQGAWMSAAPAPEPPPVLPPVPRKTAPPPTPMETQAPQVDPARQYAVAMAAYEARKLDEALGLFLDFIQEHPSHGLADNAQYWAGEVYYDKKEYPMAIAAFKKVVDKYPEEGKAPAALLKIGYAYLYGNEKEKAATYLRKVVTDYPFSELVGKARAKLSNLQTFAGSSDAYQATVTP